MNFQLIKYYNVRTFIQVTQSAPRIQPTNSARKGNACASKHKASP